MNILIDTSVWIDYFRGKSTTDLVDSFIDENVICTNYLILSEIIPALRLSKYTKLINLLKEVTNVPLLINWKKIIDYQTLCLQKGINKVGIPDLIIVDSVIQNNLVLFTLDKHFRLINDHIKFKMLRP
jgi:predicted nucleic acid-binding protein